MLIFLHLTILFLFLRDVSRFSTEENGIQLWGEWNTTHLHLILLCLLWYAIMKNLVLLITTVSLSMVFAIILPLSITFHLICLPRNPNQECKINAESNYNSGPLQFILHIFLHVLDTGSEFYHIQVGKIPTSNLVQLMLGSIKEIKMLICKECWDRSVILIGPRGWAFSTLALALWNLLHKN